MVRGRGWGLTPGGEGDGELFDLFLGFSFLSSWIMLWLCRVVCICVCVCDTYSFMLNDENPSG